MVLSVAVANSPGVGSSGEEVVGTSDAGTSWSGDFRRVAGALYPERPAVLPGTNGCPQYFVFSTSLISVVAPALHVALRTVIHECLGLRTPWTPPQYEVVTQPLITGFISLISATVGERHVPMPESFQLPFDLRDGACTRCDQEFVATACAVGGGIVADVKTEKSNPR